MKYLKKFESNSDLCVELTFNEYIEYIKSHVKDSTHLSTVKSIIKEYLGKNFLRAEVTDQSGELCVYTRNIFIKYNYFGRMEDKKVDLIVFLFLEDEYVLVSPSLEGLLGRGGRYLCDSRDGVIEFLNNKIYTI
jgi:hypothetical protein